MLETFLIIFREVLEASLIIGIVAALLKHEKKNYNKTIATATVTAILASTLLAVLFSKYTQGFTGTTEALFEGVAMLVGAILITTMIIWMGSLDHKKHLKKQVQKQLEKKYATLGIFLLVFFSIIREGIETIIFLHAIQYTSGISLIAGLLGLIAAVGLSYAFFKTSLSLKHFFSITTLLLIFFAAGLIGHGIHELEETHMISGIIYPIYDINPEVKEEGVYPPLHEKGSIGAFFKGLFGYNGNPSLLETIAYLLYMLLMGTYYYKNVMKKA